MRHKCRVMRPPFSFPRKKTGVARPKERRFPLQASSSKSCNACRLHCPVRGVAAVGVAIRFDLLLSSATALPILLKYSLISVYCQSPQCGERSNAVFGTQSAAKQTSLAPHDSKARLRVVANRRRFMAKPCTPHPIPQAAQLFELQTANVRGRGGLSSSFSGGSKGGVLFGKRTPPLTGSSAYALHSPSAQCAEKTILPARQLPFTPPGVKQLRGVLCQKNS